MDILRIFCPFLFLLIAIPSASAQFEFYRGVRSSGMGGVRIAVANDATSLMANPNGLRRVRGKTVNLLNAELTGNEEGGVALFDTNVINSINLDEYYSALSNTLDVGVYSKGQTFPSFVMRNFGVGLLANFENLSLREASGIYHLKVKKDLAVVSGFNTSFFGGVIKWGGTVRAIQREEFDGQRNPAVDSLELSDFSAKGEGVGFDTGLTFSLPWQLLPSVSVVWRDIGTTPFRATGGGLAPERILNSIDAAVSVFPIFDSYIFGSVSVEVPDILSEINSLSIDEKIRVGMELNRKDTWFFRAGYWHQTWTAGLEWANQNLQVQMASYGQPVEIGNFQTKEDRRWTLKFSFRL